MQKISVDKLINHKVLPFDIFSGKGHVIFKAGEILTPGKILQLKYIPTLYIEDSDLETQAEEEYLELLNSFDNEGEQESEADNNQKSQKEPPRFLRDYTKTNVLENALTDIKDKYTTMMETFSEQGMKDTSICLDIRDTIIDEIIPEVNKIFFKSQLKVHGNYNYSHGINVAMMCALLAHKMKLSEQTIKDITLAAMLHDIGKTEIPDEVIDKSNHTSTETKLIELHTKLGYNIIKNELGMPENIAMVALQRHERPDGTGYPYGISGKLISTESYIVAICNDFDKLTSGRGEIKVKNYKEAIRHLLDVGSKHYRSDVLYTFVHMSNYNDLTPVLIDQINEGNNNWRRAGRL